MDDQEVIDIPIGVVMMGVGTGSYKIGDQLGYDKAGTEVLFSPVKRIDVQQGEFVVVVLENEYRYSIPWHAVQLIKSKRVNANAEDEDGG